MHAACVLSESACPRNAILLVPAQAAQIILGVTCLLIFVPEASGKWVLISYAVQIDSSSHIAAARLRLATSPLLEHWIASDTYYPIRISHQWWPCGSSGGLRNETRCTYIHGDRGGGRDMAVRIILLPEIIAYYYHGNKCTVAQTYMHTAIYSTSFYRDLYFTTINTINTTTAIIAIHE